MNCKDCFYYELCKLNRGFLYTVDCNFYTSREDVYAGKIPIDEVIAI